MGTYSLRPADVKRQWHLIDAQDAPLGRLATVIARLLLGKDKPNQSPNIDGGDYVVIVNAAKLAVTGGKFEAKQYFRHSGYPGGLRLRNLKAIMINDPTEAIRRAVRGMLPDNRLRRGRLDRLKIYAGPQHQQTAQRPQPYKFKAGK